MLAGEDVNKDKCQTFLVPLHVDPNFEITGYHAPYHVNCHVTWGNIHLLQ